MTISHGAVDAICQSPRPARAGDIIVNGTPIRDEEAHVSSAATVVIRNAHILTMDPGLGDLVGDVAIQNDRIVSVGEPVPESCGQVIDALGMVLMPGFVDTHRHTWQACLRFTAVGWSLMEYMQGLQQHLAPRFSPDDVYAGNLLGAVTAIDAGITTLRDESHIQNSPPHGDAAVATLRDSGIRASFGHGWPSSVEYMTDSSLPHPADLERMRAEVLRDDDALVTMHTHLRGPALSTMATTAAELHRARDLGLRSSIHIGAVSPRAFARCGCSMSRAF